MTLWCYDILRDSATLDYLVWHCKMRIGACCCWVTLLSWRATLTLLSATWSFSVWHDAIECEAITWLLNVSYILTQHWCYLCCCLWLHNFRIWSVTLRSLLVQSDVVESRASHGVTLFECGTWNIGFWVWLSILTQQWHYAVTWCHNFSSLSVTLQSDVADVRAWRYWACRVKYWLLSVTIHLDTTMNLCCHVMPQL